VALIDCKDDDLTVHRVGDIYAGTVTAHGHAVSVAVEIQGLGHLMRVDVDHGDQAGESRELEVVGDVELTVIGIDCEGMRLDADVY